MGWKADLQKQLRQQGRKEEAAALGKDPNARLNYGVVPEQREYTVQRGESWFSIARSELGSGAKETQVSAFAQQLSNANGGLSVLRGGTKITIPGSYVSREAGPTNDFIAAALATSAKAGYEPAIKAIGGLTSQTSARGGGTIAPAPTSGIVANATRQKTGRISVATP